MKVKNKLLSGFLIGAMTITSTYGITSLKNADVAYATTYPAESKALRDAKAKIGHLTSSLKTNYLGIKNQGTWQLYIKQARDLINKIPSSEKKQRDSLTIEVNQDEALVNGLARINQVEKSIQPKSEGGYGNYLGIKNAETWNEYLRLAKIDLEKVNKSIFKKQYDELISRMNKVSLVVKEIEDKYLVEYNRILKIFEEAKITDDLEKGKVALGEAEILGSCSRTDKLKKDIRVFLYETPRETILENANRLYVGKDIAPGRYIFTAIEEDAILTIENAPPYAYEKLLVSKESDEKGVYSYTCDLVENQGIYALYKKSIKITPLKGDRKPSNVLTTGKWTVGSDIEPGEYMVNVTPGFEKNTKEYDGIEFYRNGYKKGYKMVDEYLNDKNEWKNGLKSFSITLQKGDDIHIDGIPSITFTKKIG